MTRADFRRGSAELRRAGPTRSPGKAILIVSEGEKTEPNYFGMLMKRLHLSGLVIKHPEATDPKSLTDAAEALRKERKKLAKNHGDLVPFDEVWLVYDLEKPHDERRAIHAAQSGRQRSLGIKVATSIPSFEVWLLYHYEFTTKPFESCDKVVKELKDHLPAYAKGMPLPEGIMNLIPDAVKHAERCREHHDSCGGDRDPSTEVDRLVRSLNEAATETFRFKL